jgi:hypothetical protein
MAPENSTRPKNIIISDSVLMGIEKHAYSNLKAEVGGMLFGKIDDEGNTVVIGSIPALTAAAEQISLTFTQTYGLTFCQKGRLSFPGRQLSVGITLTLVLVFLCPTTMSSFKGTFLVSQDKLL